MERILHGLVGTVCLVYLDDVLVLGRDLEEHLVNIRKVWDRIREAGLRLKPSKCKLVREEVEYLGYVVSSKGIAAAPNKVSAIQQYPTPKDLKALRSFLGLASFYRRFIPCFSVVAGPLFSLTKKDVSFQWGESCQKAFQQLKDSLSSAPVP